MISLLCEFVLRCKQANITPCEIEIEAFLNGVGKIEYSKEFTEICFYYWDKLIE